MSEGEVMWHDSLDPINSGNPLPHSRGIYSVRVASNKGTEPARTFVILALFWPDYDLLMLKLPSFCLFALQITLKCYHKHLQVRFRSKTCWEKSLFCTKNKGRLNALW